MTLVYVGYYDKILLFYLLRVVEFVFVNFRLTSFGWHIVAKGSFIEKIIALLKRLHIKYYIFFLT